MQAKKKKNKNLPNFAKRFLQMLLRQTVAALLFVLLVLGFTCTGSAPLNACADALGRALRYESRFDVLIQTGQQLKDQVQGWFQEETSL